MRKRINKIKRLENESIEDYIKRLSDAGQVVPATNDYIFKTILSKEDNHNILCYLVSNIIGLNYDYIKDKLVLRNNELLKNNILQKGMVTDLIVGLEGLIVNIEMQVEDSKSIRFKNNSYHHKLMSDNKDVDTEIYQIVFNKKRRFKNIINEYIMMDRDGEKEEDFIRYHVSLDNVSEKYYNNLELSRFEKVLMIINSYSIEELRELGENDEELYNMCQSIEEMSKDPTFLAAGVYNKEEMEENLKRWYRQEFRAEGLKEGREEGSLQKEKEMVLKMYEIGISLDLISKTSGLTEQEILNIINKKDA